MRCPHFRDGEREGIQRLRTGRWGEGDVEESERENFLFFFFLETCSEASSTMVCGSIKNTDTVSIRETYGSS